MLTSLRNHKALAAAPAGLVIVALIAVLFLLLQHTRAPITDSLFQQVIVPAQIDTGRSVQALAALELTAAREGWTPERLRLAGDLWAEIGDTHRAFDYWEAAGLVDDTAFLERLAQTALMLSNWSTAEQALRTLHRREPDQASWQAHLGFLLIANGNTSGFDMLSDLANTAGIPDGETAEALMLAWQGGDDLVSRLHRVGLVFAERENWSLAAAAFERAAVSPDAPPLIYAYLGWAQDHVGLDGGNMIRQAVNAAPEDAYVRLIEGLHWRYMGDNSRSLESLIIAAALDPNSAALLAELGTAYQLLDDFASARYWYERALILSNGDARYQALLDALSPPDIEALRLFGIEPGTIELTPETVP